jgi:lysophospholipase
VPMPVLVADNRAPGETVISSNTTVFEFNPWEFGTFDPTTFGFAPLEYLGSNFSAGVLPKGEKCVRGFDNAGLIMGTSSSLFNEGLLMVNNSAFPSFLKTTFNSILGKIGDANEDIADYSPNPFFHYNNATSPSAYSTSLSMVDGGEDLQNIPLHPLVQPSRHVDVIFAIDSSADTEYNWPNGTALVATYERSLNARGIANGTAFPAIPDQNTFINLKLNTRPTFFGCNSSNLTGPAPLVVYIPNFPYMTYSNVSTFDPKYDNTQRNAVIENGYNAATMANATGDAGWPACVACAILSRSLERTGTAVSEVCKQCFADHCWDGTLNSTTPLSYQPTLKLSAAAAATTTSGESLARTQSTLGLTVALGVVLAVIV